MFKTYKRTRYHFSAKIFRADEARPPSPEELRLYPTLPQYPLGNTLGFGFVVVTLLGRNLTKTS